jgi:tetratricopeptide (TPR) repeat protein
MWKFRKKSKPIKMSSTGQNQTRESVMDPIEKEVFGLLQVSNKQREAGNSQIALAYVDQALTIIETHPWITSKALAACQSNKGKLLEDLGRLPEALEAQRQALKLSRRHLWRF